MSHLGPSLRRYGPRARRRWRRAALAVGLSLAVNALLLAKLDVSWLGRLPPPGSTPRSVELAPLSPSQWAANRSVAPDARSRPAPARQPPPPAPPPRQAPGQVVESAPSSDERPPKESRFVSERNNTVEKETRSRHTGTGGPGAPGPRSDARPPPAVAMTGPQPGSKARPAQPQPGTRAERGKVALAPGPRADLPPSSLPSIPGGAPGEARLGESEGDASGPLARLNLRPGAQEYERLAGGGGGGSPDHIEGVEEGEGTWLNTREWRYAGYFNRIKQAVAEHWKPQPALVARDPNGSRYGYKDWHTLLSVKLDGAGALKAVSVAQPSGLDFLDRTAVEAFREAQPFNNPPAGLADERGDIVFTFGFYLQMGNPGLRLFRGP